MARTKRISVKARLLVIDDRLDQQIIIQEAIRQTFAEVDLLVMSAPEEVIDYLQDCLQATKGFPDLIVLDLYLPTREASLELLRQIRALPHPVKDLPVMVLSNSSNPEDIRQAYKQGVNAYTVKPALFSEWLTYFATIRDYWWNTAVLPKNRLQSQSQ